MDFINLPQPKSYMQEILYTLIRYGYVSLKDFPFLHGFRTRISELKNLYNLNLQAEQIITQSRYGNRILYHKHILNPENKELAITVYKQLTNGK